MKTLKQFQEATGYLKVKSPDEQKFVDKHGVETIADKNGNGDEVFKASTTKKIERKKHRKGYDPGEDESVYEEIEDLDELKRETVRSYYNKAGMEGKNAAARIKVGGGDRSGGKDTQTLKKRAKGREMALNRRYGKVPTSEEVEQVDELSKSTLGSYVKKATNQAFNQGFAGGANLSRGQEHEKQGERQVNKAVKRVIGVNKAVNKLTKEEADYLIGRYADFKESIDQLAPRLQEAMYFVFDRLNEENQDVFMTSCETYDGLEQMVAFAIENRGN